LTKAILCGNILLGNDIAEVINMEAGNDRQLRRESENAHRQDPRAPENVGTKTFGSREPSQVSRFEACYLPGCAKRLLGTFGFTKQVQIDP
jgi:hypothetical protein